MCEFPGKLHLFVSELQVFSQQILCLDHVSAERVQLLIVDQNSILFAKRIHRSIVANQRRACQNRNIGFGYSCLSHCWTVIKMCFVLENRRQIPSWPEKGLVFVHSSRLLLSQVHQRENKNDSEVSKVNSNFFLSFFFVFLMNFTKSTQN